MSWASWAPYIFEGVKLGAQYGAAEMSSRDRKKWEKEQRAASRRANLINVASGGRTNVRPEFTEFEAGKGARLFSGLAQGASIAQTVKQLNDARKLRQSQLDTQKLQQEAMERQAGIDSGAAMAAGDWDKRGLAGIRPGTALSTDTPWLPSADPAAATTTPAIALGTTPSPTARPEELLEMPASLTQRPSSVSRGAPVTMPAAKPVAAPITGLGTSDRPLQLSDNVTRGDVDLRGLGLSQLDRTAPTTPQELSNVDRLAADRTALASTQPPGGVQFPSGYSPEASARRLRDVSRTDIPAALQGRGGLDFPPEPRLLAGAPDAEMPTLEKVATNKLEADFGADTDPAVELAGGMPVMPETVIEAKADAPTRTKWEQLGYSRQSLIFLEHAADTQDDTRSQAIVAAKAVLDDNDLFIDMNSDERLEVYMGLAAHGKSEEFIRKFMQGLPLQAATDAERKQLATASSSIDDFLSLKALVMDAGSDFVGIEDQPWTTLALGEGGMNKLKKVEEINARLKAYSLSVAEAAGQQRLSDFDMRFFGEIAGDQIDRYSALLGKFNAMEEVLRLGSKKMLTRFEGARLGMYGGMPANITEVGGLGPRRFDPATGALAEGLEEFPSQFGKWSADPRWGG